jgi:hypothetical protein
MHRRAGKDPGQAATGSRARPARDPGVLTTAGLVVVRNRDGARTLQQSMSPDPGEPTWDARSISSSASPGAPSTTRSLDPGSNAIWPSPAQETSKLRSADERHSSATANAGGERESEQKPQGSFVAAGYPVRRAGATQGLADRLVPGPKILARHLLWNRQHETEVSMDKSSAPDSLAARGLSVLRSVGAWVAIHPEQTYVATSIRGLGECTSAYCPAQRRELGSRDTPRGPNLAPLLAVALAAIGLLSSCATYRPIVDLRDVSDRGQYERDLADCQNYAAPVSPGASAGAGALFGAILGAALGAAVGDHELAREAARFGAVEGAVAGGGAGAGTQVNIIRNCMSGRGYVVLN